MRIINSTDENKVILGKPKKWFQIRSVNGNLCITYDKENRIYILERNDGKPFDGITEDTGAIFAGSFEKPNTLEEVIEYEVNSLSGLQIEPEVSMYTEFDWAFNEDKTRIIIYPVFLKELICAEVNLPNEFDSIENGVSLSLGTKKSIRNKISKKY